MEDRIETYQEERPWGNFRRFTNNAPSTVKIITVKPGEELSLQSHTKRAEFWRVISGDGVFDIDGESYPVLKGAEYFIPIGIKHRIKSGTEGLEILEIAFGDFEEGDIVRYEDKYGRI